MSNNKFFTWTDVSVLAIIKLWKNLIKFYVFLFQNLEQEKHNFLIPYVVSTMIISLHDCFSLIEIINMTLLWAVPNLLSYLVARIFLNFNLAEWCLINRSHFC